MNSTCSMALLESALAGNLPAEDEYSFHRHLETCEACSAATAVCCDEMLPADLMPELLETLRAGAFLAAEQRAGFTRMQAYSHTEQAFTPSSVGLNVLGSSIFPQISI